MKTMTFQESSEMQVFLFVGFEPQPYFVYVKLTNVVFVYGMC